MTWLNAVAGTGAGSNLEMVAPALSHPTPASCEVRSCSTNIHKSGDIVAIVTRLLTFLVLTRGFLRNFNYECSLFGHNNDGVLPGAGWGRAAAVWVIVMHDIGNMIGIEIGNII